MALGGFLSAALAGRLQAWSSAAPCHGAIAPGHGRRRRAVMGLGAVLARGCTSGLAHGQALLSVGGWAFMLCAFAGAYAVAPAMRRSWR